MVVQRTRYPFKGQRRQWSITVLLALAGCTEVVIGLASGHADLAGLGTNVVLAAIAIRTRHGWRSRT